MNVSRTGTILVLVAATAGLCGCGTSDGKGAPAAPPGAGTSSTMSMSSGGMSSSSSTPAAATALITIDAYKYTVPASVAPGATVSVKNLDVVNHTVTADDGSFTDPATAEKTTTFTAPTKPGSYPFTCTIHPEMKGVLVVR
ncbi:MAG: cupredoxin domain-containing protein [Nostocoides sp.]